MLSSSPHAEVKGVSQRHSLIPCLPQNRDECYARSLSSEQHQKSKEKIPSQQEIINTYFKSSQRIKADNKGLCQKEERKKQIQYREKKKPVLDSIKEKLKKIQENCSGSTSTNSYVKVNKKFAELENIRNKFKKILQQYKMRETSINEANKRLQEENNSLKDILAKHRKCFSN